MGNWSSDLRYLLYTALMHPLESVSVQEYDQGATAFPSNLFECFAE
jgi:hypothetical protein